MRLCLLFIMLLSCICSYMHGDTISRPGYYTLGYDPVNTSGTTYTITASNVILDLNSHIITGSLIGVDITLGVTNVTIKNGTIAKVSNEAVLVRQGCQNITLSNLRTTLCNTGAFTALVLTGAATSFISNVVIDGCSMDSCILGGGFDQNNLCFATSCSSVTIRNCTVVNNVLSSITVNSESLRAALILNCYDTSIDNVIMSNNRMGVGGLVLMQTCTGFTISNSNFYNNNLNILGAGAFDHAIRLPQVFNGTIANCSISNNTINMIISNPPVQYGCITCDAAASNIVITDCLCTNNQFTGGGTGRGVCLGFASNVSDIVVRNTVVANNSSTLAVSGFFGFFITNNLQASPTTFCQLENCAAYNNLCDFNDNGGSTSIAGFELAFSVSHCSLINCMSINNTSTAGQAMGFNLIATGSNLFQNCLAAYNNGDTDAHSFGFDVVTSSFNSFVGCAAVRNGPSAPLAANQFVTAAGGVPASSVKTAAYTALSGEQLQYSNEGIT